MFNDSIMFIIHETTRVNAPSVEVVMINVYVIFLNDVLCENDTSCLK